MAAHLKPSERCFCRGRDDRAAMQTLFLAKEREGRARRLYRISDSAAEPRHEIRAVAVRMFDRCLKISGVSNAQRVATTPTWVLKASNFWPGPDQSAPTDK